MNMLKNEFIDHGGDPFWLEGLKAIPAKLQNLYEINKILAHTPWLLNKCYIENLTKGEGNWSLSELVHAIILLVHFHSLSTFLFSCGITKKLENLQTHSCEFNSKSAESLAVPDPERPANSPVPISRRSSQDEDSLSSSPPSIVGEQEVKLQTLMERMKDLSEKSDSFEFTEEELAKRFETIEKQSAELVVAPLRTNTVLEMDIGLFIEEPSYIYQDFTKCGQLSESLTFRVQDYSWADHGYSLVTSLYTDVGNLLDDKFKTAYNLTYKTMGEHSEVDTSRFRIAIWNYIQCLYGIKHDDYDYDEINQLLEDSLKTFIKNAVCYPERVTKKDYDRVMTEFKESEKVHVNLIIFEARMQAELLYALRSMMHFMT
ncbi:PREDICTED: sestrin homolog isoform X2 [Ceratosolen solmsi marchali]|nr:PREDICTED: sestrin homolog isoform X2 [Ceratosolen solmsi marchali]